MPAAEAAPRPAPIPVAPAVAPQESVAEKLMRIRSAVAQTAAPYGEEEESTPQAAADQLPEDFAPEPTARDLSVEDILPEVAGVYPRIMQSGEMDAGAWSCGMVAGLIHDVPTCRELVDRIMGEAETIIAQRLAGMRAA